MLERNSHSEQQMQHNGQLSFWRGRVPVRPRELRQHILPTRETRCGQTNNQEHNIATISIRYQHQWQSLVGHIQCIHFHHYPNNNSHPVKYLVSLQPLQPRRRRLDPQSILHLPLSSSVSRRSMPATRRSTHSPPPRQLHSLALLPSSPISASSTSFSFSSSSPISK